MTDESNVVPFKSSTAVELEGDDTVKVVVCPACIEDAGEVSIEFVYILDEGWHCQTCGQALIDPNEDYIAPPPEFNPEDN